ncbi:MAG: NAD(+) synthase [Lentisphaerae bacterium]|nr:NAD(+) synthase [Lentisphaerota bacterium]
MLGFYRLAAATPRLHLANPAANAEEIIALYNEAAECSTAAVVFPEMCITGYTIGDLIFQESLLQASEAALLKIAAATAGKNTVAVVGTVLKVNGRLFNTAVVIQYGQILGAVPKQQLPNYREFSEKRFFTSGRDQSAMLINIGEHELVFGTDLIFDAGGKFIFGIEICEDLWSIAPPSNHLALAGALAIFNPAACTEQTGKADFRRDLVAMQSARLNAAYVLAPAGIYESTTDAVYAGQSIIAANGNVENEGERFWRKNYMIYSDIDFEFLESARRTNSSFLDQPQAEYNLIRCPENAPDSPDLEAARIDPMPFWPLHQSLESMCEDIFNIQVTGLMRRFEASRSKCMVIGVSGGLDSTLALLVAYKCTQLLELPPDIIKAFTMPGFGTTATTRGNSEKLCDCLNIPVQTVDITPACRQHFDDIGHDPTQLDTTYENVQARERTQILMDIANKAGGMVIGTGDLSEMALGWCTYNGDHMSMYSVNSSVPKSIIRRIVEHQAEINGGELAQVLLDILATPVSPELLPPDASGAIEQKTEDIIGPYELHDFFLYHFIQGNFAPRKIVAMAEKAWQDVYSREVIEQTMKIFLRRFMTQQFKRSCSPDGPQATAVSLSPRCAWRMPSDAETALFE